MWRPCAAAWAASLVTSRRAYTSVPAGKSPASLLRPPASSRGLVLTSVSSWYILTTTSAARAVTRRPPLAMRGADPGRIGVKTPGLGVLQPGPVPHRVHRIRPGHDRLQVIRDDDLENAAEERPRLLTARDHLLHRLGERQVDEAVPGEHRSEHQPPHQPPPALTRHHPQAPEVPLQLPPP